MELSKEHVTKIWKYREAKRIDPSICRFRRDLMEAYHVGDITDTEYKEKISDRVDVIVRGPSTEDLTSMLEVLHKRSALPANDCVWAITKKAINASEG